MRFNSPAGVSDTVEAGDQFGKSIVMVPYCPVGAAAGAQHDLTGHS